MIEIIEFTDPVCTWCWGSEPVLRKLETVYEDRIKISFVMGGLVEDIRNFRDERNNIGGDLSQDNHHIAKHWLEASERHGMPVETHGFNLMTEDHPSTYPENIAYKAAQFQGEKLAQRFLRRIREATAAEARQTNRQEVLIALAGECGLDIAKFESSLSDGTAETAFREDLKIAAAYSVSGFPSFLIRNPADGKEILLKGYQPFENFARAINRISNVDVTQKKIVKTPDDITNFVGKYDRVTPAEVAMVFELSTPELESSLRELEQQNRVCITPAGNGYFISTSHEAISSTLS